MSNSLNDLFPDKEDKGRIEPMIEFPSIKEAFDEYFTPEALKPISGEEPVASKASKVEEWISWVVKKIGRHGT